VPVNEDDDLVDAIAQVAFAVMAVLSKVGAENELSLTQLRVLGILRGRRLRMTELASHLGLEKSTLSGLIDRAERRGLVERAADPNDGRVVEVFLSPAGVELGERLSAVVREALVPMTGELSGTDRRRLRSLLERMLGETTDSQRGVPSRDGV
jgi:DNA-binding MarR family transcriptional regulator